MLRDLISRMQEMLAQLENLNATLNEETGGVPKLKNKYQSLIALELSNVREDQKRLHKDINILVLKTFQKVLEAHELKWNNEFPQPIEKINSKKKDTQLIVFSN